MTQVDVIIIGAGASGLFCAKEAARRGRQVIVLDHAERAGKKILASGGGRCNFTNYEVDSSHFISANRHFCKSALSRYSQWNFLELIREYKILFHARDHGQLFCDRSASEVLTLLLDQCQRYDVKILTEQKITKVERLDPEGFSVTANRKRYTSASLVIASGGLSMNNLGASDFGYLTAKSFGHSIVTTRPGLVPLTLNSRDKISLSPLAGIAIPATVSCREIRFTDNLLFTHRGISGPVILQISNYWLPGDPITIDLLPGIDLLEELKGVQRDHPQRFLKSYLQTKLPKRLIMNRFKEDFINRPMQTVSQKDFIEASQRLQQWILFPAGNEGYKSAEVTVGGVNTDEVSSKTMESRKVSGLYFTGEVLDVTGWLGGYNLQWAWSSGWCAGQYV